MFDVASLLAFDPPVSRCVRCRGLLTSKEVADVHRVSCPACGVTYLSSAFRNEMFGSFTGTAARPETLGDHLRSRGLGVDLGQAPLEHAQLLASLAAQLSRAEQVPHIRTLMQLLLSARCFIHVITFGLDEPALAMLQLVSQQVPISVIVSNARPALVENWPAGQAVSPNLELVIAGKAGTAEDQPHQKLVVIDGLVAVTGSVNFTTPAWRKAEKGFETVDPITDIQDVIRRNNQGFAPVWRRFTDPVSAHMGWTYVDELDE